MACGTSALGKYFARLGGQRDGSLKGERRALLRVGLPGSVDVAVPVFVLATAVTMEPQRQWTMSS